MKYRLPKYEGTYQSQNANNAHDLYINSTLLDTERQSYKYNGETVRCVARSTLKN